MLVTEDDEISLEFLKLILEGQKITVVTARDGKEAVEVCQNNNDIDLVLMDIKMPNLDGYSATKIIKEIRPDLPVIAQTAYVLQIDREKYSGVFDDYLAKPVNKSILKETVAKYM